MLARSEERLFVGASAPRAGQSRLHHHTGGPPMRPTGNRRFSGIPGIVRLSALASFLLVLPFAVAFHASAQGRPEVPARDAAATAAANARNTSGTVNAGTIGVISGGADGT